MNNILMTLAISLAISELTSVSALHLDKRRFGQQNPPVLEEIQALGKLANDNSGKFQSLAGAFIRPLIGSSDSCSRYKIIEELVALCKSKNIEKQGILVATKLAAAEKNFNPANGKGKPSFCNDPAIPSIPEIRCVVPIIDPDFEGASEFNAKVNERLAQIQASPNPQLCAGQSVQQQAIALGISGCAGCDGAGTPPVSSIPDSSASTD